MSWARRMWSVFSVLCGILVICIIAVNIVNWSSVEKKCIENYRSCENSIKPCCRQQRLEAPCDMPEDFICNHFDGGHCKPLSEIKNLDEYIKMTKKLSTDNISNRTILYWNTVGLSTMDSITLYVKYFYIACISFLLFMGLVYYVRLAMNYVPVQSNDIPPWN